MAFIPVRGGDLTRVDGVEETVETTDRDVVDGVGLSKAVDDDERKMLLLLEAAPMADDGRDEGVVGPPIPATPANGAYDAYRPVSPSRYACEGDENTGCAGFNCPCNLFNCCSSACISC